MAALHFRKSRCGAASLSLSPEKVIRRDESKEALQIANGGSANCSAVNSGGVNSGSAIRPGLVALIMLESYGPRPYSIFTCGTSRLMKSEMLTFCTFAKNTDSPTLQPELLPKEVIPTMPETSSPPSFLKVRTAGPPESP